MATQGSALDTRAPHDLLIDVSGSVEEPAQLAGTYYPAAVTADRPVLVCLPGGTYTRGYFDLEVPGYPGYSFANDAAAEGFPVVTFDQLGTGGSTRPVRDIDLVDQAAAVSEALAELPTIIGRDGPFIAVAHSMGGYVAMLQQAADAPYAGLAILGTTNQHVAPLNLPKDVIDASATPAGRAELATQMLTAMPDRYLEDDRSFLRSLFYLEDVPAGVVAADLASTLTVVPRRCAASATVPGVTSAAANTVTVPVFLGYGEVDVSPSPHSEPTFFPRSSDVTLFVLAGSGHCHNMATTRTRLWDRLTSWCLL